MEVERDDLRTDLEAAFEEYEAEERGPAANPEEPLRAAEQEAAPVESAAPTDEPEVGEPGEKSADGRVRGEDGKFKKVLKDFIDQPGDKPVPAKPAAAPAATGPEIKAPVAWKTGAKGEWAKIPRAAQEEIARREIETSKVLSQTANARKHYDEFNQTIAPFMPLIRAQNSEPMAAVKNLMTTAAGLTIGSPQQKAQIVAEMIGNFGIDIDMLDNLLAAAPRGRQQPAGTSQVEVAIQRQLQPVYDFMNKINQTHSQREVQLRQDADAAVEEFSSKHDFFEELRDDIADLMEVAANRGRNMTLDQAYKVAVSSHPEYAAATQQRVAAARAQQNGSVQKARKAASSIAGNPVVSTPGKDAASRRDEIAAAWDNQIER